MSTDHQEPVGARLASPASSTAPLPTDPARWPTLALQHLEHLIARAQQAEAKREASIAERQGCMDEAGRILCALKAYGLINLPRLPFHSNHAPRTKRSSSAPSLAPAAAPSNGAG